MTVDMNKLYMERKDRIVKAMQLEQPDRVPLIPPEEGYWVSVYGGYTINDTSLNNELLAKAWEKTMVDFPEWDALYAPNCVWSRILFEFAGSSHFVLAGKEGTSGKMHQYKQESNMSAEEYEELIQDPYKFLVEKILPRRCSEINQPFPRNMIAFAKSVMEYNNWLEFWGKKYSEWAEKFGMPVLAGGFTEAPIDFIMDHLRGFKEMSLDLRRLDGEIIKKACEALLPYMIKWGAAGAINPNIFPPIFIPLHFAPFLSPNDFKEYYWPTFSKLVNSLVEKGLGVIIYCEADWTPHMEYLKELPRGKVIAQFETMDMKKAKKILGNTICIMGNLPAELLVYGTKEKIEEATKRLIDDAADGGGYIMSTDKIFGEEIDPKLMKYWGEATLKYGVYK